MLIMFNSVMSMYEINYIYYGRRAFRIIPCRQYETSSRDPETPDSK